MYIPHYSKENDLKEIKELIRENPFATLISVNSGEPLVNHLPIVLDEMGDETGNDRGYFKLIGHMARANPQWRGLKEALLIFHGPHAYITPNWYPEKLNVPTWNYATAHVYGQVRLIEDADGLNSILSKSVDVFEASSPKPWKFELPSEFTKDLLTAIVGFEIQVTRFECKYKLSQNRTPEDRAGVLAGLKTRTDEMSRKVLEMMLRQT